MEILTESGTVLTGMKLDAPGVANRLRFQGADGKVFELDLKDIEEQEPIRESIMPVGLEEQFSVDELRDLVAFLLNEEISQ